MALSFFDGLRSILRDMAGDVRPVENEDDSDAVILAIAALLFHVVDADGVVTEAERTRLETVLVEDYGLSREKAAEMAEAGRRANDEAVDLYRFTSVLKSHLDEQARVRFVEALWEVTFADGEVHELEDNVIWRVSDLLGVSTRDRMLRKQRVAGRAEG